jgi:transcription antitermination factor NusG
MSEIVDASANASYEVVPPCSLNLGKWYALQTVPRHEKMVSTQLQMDGLEIFVPTFRKENKWTDRRKLVDLPLFPGYAFLRSNDIHSERKFIFRNRSVVRLLSGSTGPAEIPLAEVENVRRLTQTGAQAEPIPYLNVGQRVRIRNGALQGLEGVLVKVARENCLVISVDLIQRSISIRIQGYEIEPI